MGMYGRFLSHEPELLDSIKKLYLEGNSAQEIKDLLELPFTARSIQRQMEAMGIIRSQGASFRLAVKKGRVPYYTNPDKIKRVKVQNSLRFRVLERDGSRCVKCGATAQTAKITIDHINEDKNDNRMENLQVLCEECNQGKYWASDKAWRPAQKGEL